MTEEQEAGSTPEWLDELCDRLSSGEGINEITADQHMPAERTVYYHQAKDEAVCRRIARARVAQQDYEADNCIKMADAATADDFQVVKLRIWARQWRASKLAPKKYGDRITHAGDENNPVVTREIGKSESARRIAFAIRNAQRQARGDDGGGSDEEL